METALNDLPQELPNIILRILLWAGKKYIYLGGGHTQTPSTRISSWPHNGLMAKKGLLSTFCKINNSPENQQ